jgi:hypothetical protein
MNTTKILVDGGILAVLMTTFLLGVALYNPRLFLNKGDIPRDILEAVPPKTRKEKRLSILIGVPFLMLAVGFPLYSTVGFNQGVGGDASFWLLFAHALGVLLIPFFVDLLILDWLIFCTLTPRFIVFPGTEGFAGYKDYGFHLKAHARGILFLILSCAAIAVLAGLV